MLRRSFFSATGGSGSSVTLAEGTGIDIVEAPVGTFTISVDTSEFSLAGDVTGLASANTVVTLTGSAGVVTVPTAALAFGAAPATAGAGIRLSNLGFISSRNGANNANVFMLGLDASNIMYVGNGSGAPTTIQYISTTAQSFVVAGSTYFSLASSAVQALVPTVQWGLSVVAPTLNQATKTTNATPQDLTIQTQAPFNNVATTGANNVPGSLVLDLGTNTNSYTTTAPKVLFNFAGATRGSLVFDALTTANFILAAASGGASDPFLRLVGGGSWLLSGTSTGSLQAASQIAFFLTGVIPFVATTTTLSVGVPAVTYAETVVAPTFNQAARIADVTAPANLTIRPQQPFATATGNNRIPGNLILDMGTPTNAGVTYGQVRFTTDSLVRAFTYWDSSTFYLFQGDASTTAGRPYLGLSANTFLNGSSTATITSPVQTNVTAGSVGLAVTTSTCFISNAAFTFTNAVTAPQLTVQTNGADVIDCPTLLIRPMQPFATATGSHRTPGSLVLDMGTPTNAGTTYGDILFTAGGSNRLKITTDGSTFTSITGPSANAQILWILSGNGGLNYDTGGAAGLHKFRTAGSDRMTIDSTTCTMSALTQLTAPALITCSSGVAWLIQHGNRSGDNATFDLSLKAQAASATATGTNKNGGTLLASGGDRTDTAGRRKGVQVGINASVILLEATDVQAEATSPSRVVALLRTAAITTTQMPTGTGDLVQYWGNCATAPTANPVGGSITYVEAGATKIRGTGGTVTTIAPA